jgi:hypothetical protein
MVTTAEAQDGHGRVEFPHQDCELRSAEIGHPAIRDQLVEWTALGQGASRKAIQGFNHFIVFRPEGTGRETAERNLVLDEQNAGGHRGAFGRQEG